MSKAHFVEDDLLAEKNEKYRKQGKKNKAKGARFETKVRKDLISKGWIVSKWQNNVVDKKCVPAKPGYFRMMQTGFPDFICYRTRSFLNDVVVEHEVIFVECKTNGYLKPIEREKAKWYFDNKYCSYFLIAKEGEKRGEIIYEDFISLSK